MQTNFDHVFSRLYHTESKTKYLQLQQKIYTRKYRSYGVTMKMTDQNAEITMKETKNERIMTKGRCVPRYNFV